MPDQPDTLAALLKLLQTLAAGGAMPYEAAFIAGARTIEAGFVYFGKVLDGQTPDVRKALGELQLEQIKPFAAAAKALNALFKIEG